jgi:hypothetical protein
LRNADIARAAYKTIRGLRQNAPILTIISDEGRAPGRPRDGRTERHIAAADLDDEDRITGVFDALGVTLPVRALKIGYDQSDPGVRALLQAVPLGRLELTIQKYFPDAEQAEIQPVAGGFSGDPLCWLFVHGQPHGYYLKFFASSGSYQREFAGHVAAQQWLGGSTVELNRVPDLDYTEECGIEAFPSRKSPSFYPICYKSASTRKSKRLPFHDLYRVASDEFAAQTIDQLLRVLSQQDSIEYPSEIPWSDAMGRGFRLEPERVKIFHNALADLNVYGAALCRDWTRRRTALGAFLFGPAPTWLLDPVPVAIGRIHGDPNSRNCLVDPGNAANLQLIDCGGYKRHGRLVADLALLECDIKFGLLGCEQASVAPVGIVSRILSCFLPQWCNSRRFLDLDSSRVCSWREAEAELLACRLDYTVKVANRLRDPSIRRAYRLMAAIRSRAKEVSLQGDPNAQHYFAALLYWTIKILKFNNIPPTKKLLALYSISEILDVFARN